MVDTSVSTENFSPNEAVAGHTVGVRPVLHQRHGEHEVHHITIRLEDDRFDDMPAEEVPALLFDMIRHRLWNLTDPRAHISEIVIDVPPEPEAPSAAALVVDPVDLVDRLEQTLDAIGRDLALAHKTTLAA